MNVTAESLSQQISQYINELTDLSQHLRNRDKRLPNIKLLQHKISIKLAHFQTALQHMRSHHRPTASVKQISQHLASSFSQIVKEAHRLLQVRPGEEGENRLRNKLIVLRDLENQMNQDWQRGFKPKDQGILRRIDDKTSMLAADVDQNQLRSLAKEYLQKEFLAIRVVAYKMYQQYTAHHHSKYNEQIRQLYQEQEQLSRQAAEAAEVNKDLKAEEKILVRQLNELRTTNELISKRYFQSGNSAQKGE